MFKKTNEKGMALVVVLLMITIFTILCLSLFNLTISNAKQINKTEEDMQSVDAAEMGVIYYKNIFTKQVGIELTTEINKVISLIARDNQNNIEKELPELEYTASNILNSPYFNLDSSKLLPIVPTLYNVDRKNKINYQIKNIVTDTSNYPNILEVTFDSYGASSSDKDILNVTIKLDIEKIISEALIHGEGEIPASTISITKPNIPSKPLLTFNTPAEPTTNKQASINYTDGTVNNKTLYSDTNITFNNSVADINESTFYAKNGSLLFNNQLEKGINTSTLYGNSNITFNNSISNIGITSSTLYALENMTFGNQTWQEVSGINDSNLYSKFNITFNTVNDGINNNSLLFAEKSLIFKNDLNHGINKSKLYSHDTITFENQLNGGISNESILYSEGTLSFNNSLSGGIFNSDLYSRSSIIFNVNVNDGISNSVIYSDGTLSFGQPNNWNGVNKGIINSKLYSRGDLTFNSAINDGLTNSTIYSEGIATFFNIHKGIVNSKIFVNKNATFQHISDGIHEGSLIIINGSASFNLINQGINSNSTLFIQGNANFGNPSNQKVEVSNNSLVCVGGTISGGINENGINVISKGSHPTEFNNRCSGIGGDNSSSIPPTLGDIFPTIDGQIENFIVKYN